ncbi:MAG: nucleotidyltransferase [Pyrobaculum sp.]
MVVWVEVLKRVYPALASRYGAVVGGSQVFYIILGLALPSKDIDIFIEDFNPLLVSRVLAEALGLEEERFEVFRKGDNLVFHFFVPVGAGVVAVEIMSKTHLGRISETPLFREVVFVNRDGVDYWALSLEAYAVLQATRPDGPRDVDLARFRLVRDRMDWGRAMNLAEALGVRDKLEAFCRQVCTR